VVILLTRTLGRAGALPPVSSRDGASVTADKIAPGRSSQAR
jgi:hypothetical protein